MTEEADTDIAKIKVRNNSVGVIFWSKDTGRQLFLLRNDRNVLSWGLPGGKCERNETLLDALQRECREEIQFWTADLQVFPLEHFSSDDGRFVYHTFYCVVPYEFKPTLNHEHLGYCWVDDHTYPRPLHRGLFNTLNYDIIQQKIAIIRQSIK